MLMMIAWHHQNSEGTEVADVKTKRLFVTGNVPYMLFGTFVVNPSFMCSFCQTSDVFVKLNYMLHLIAEVCRLEN
jgi:hypothetical protein